MRELFERLLPIFLENGGKLFEFYDMTYGEIMLIIEANRKRVKQEYQMQATVAYQTARLNSFAFNKPEDMPPIEKMFPGLFDDVIKEKKETTQDWRIMRDNLLVYADVHNKSHEERGGLE